MVDVSIITPVWNRADLTAKFLWANWGLYAGRPDVEFVVVNNGSTDNTPAAVAPFQALFGERLKVYSLEYNIGFGPGHNYGANRARGDVFILLSNDVTPNGDYVTPICQALDEEPGALVGPEMLRHDTGWNKFDGQVIAYLAGWCVACRRATWERLGGWDERYVPCDYEDMDLSYTALKAGVPLLQIPLPLSHAFGSTIRQAYGDAGRLAITQRSRALFVEKWGLHATT